MQLHVNIDQPHNYTINLKNVVISHIRVEVTPAARMSAGKLLKILKANAIKTLASAESRVEALCSLII